MSVSLYNLNCQLKKKVFGAKSCAKMGIEKVFVRSAYHKKFEALLNSTFKTVYVLDSFPDSGNFNYSVVGFK